MIVGRDSEHDESLERSIACFRFALDDSTRPQGRHAEKVLSFQWISVMVCLQEVDRFQKTRMF